MSRGAPGVFAQLSQWGNEPESASERRLSLEVGAARADGDDAQVVSFIRQTLSREDGEVEGVGNDSYQETPV